MCKINNIPSDFTLMKEIYVRHYKEFKDFTKGEPSRETKIYVPIDIKSIAKRFSADENMIFGRLYYHLEKKYGYTNDDGSLVPFFSSRVGQDKNAVNFPLLASIVSGLREERSTQLTTRIISISAIIISVLTLSLNGFQAWVNSQKIVEPHSISKQLEWPQK